MRNILSIFILLLLTNFVNAQSANFFTDGSRWVYHNQETWEPGQQFLLSSDEQDIIHGDTLIGGIVYLKLYTTFHNSQVVYNPPFPPQTYYTYDSIGPSFLRYDTTQKRVYYLPHPGSTERLIYDFNLQVGDTTPMQSIIFPSTVIDSIDTIILFGVPLKRFFLDIGQNTINPEHFIIEGLGGSNGLTHFQPTFGSISGGFNMTLLNCFQFEDSIFSPTNGSCPFIEFVSEVRQIPSESDLVIVPNPAHDYFEITISPEFLNSKLIILDCQGRVTKSITMTESTLSTRLSSRGIYFWVLENKGTFVETGKLVIQ